KCALAYLRPDFFELARKTPFKNLRHPPEALTLFSRDMPTMQIKNGFGFISPLLKVKDFLNKVKIPLILFCLTFT
ncbi:hypothetical protein, partial [Fredinandcohnia quinoae]